MMAKRSYRWLFVLLAAVGLLADQGTKYGMFRWLYNDRQEQAGGRFESWADTKSWYPPEGDKKRFLAGGRYDVIPGWFGFIAESTQKADRVPWGNPASKLQTWSAPEMPHVNEGALFGMGGESGNGNTIFAIISVLAAVGIIVWAALRGKQADGWMCAALGLILGGTVGNCYDRIVFEGVRDFLYFYKINWPVFNVADCCLVCGAIILLGHAFLVGTPKAEETEPGEPTLSTVG